MGQLFKDNKNYLFDDLVPMNSSSQALRLVKASTTTTTITTINQCKATYELRNLLFQQMRGTKRSRRQCPRNQPMENLCLSILNLSTDSRSRPEAKLIIRSSAKRVWEEKKRGWCWGWTPTRSKPRRQIVRHPRGTVSPLRSWWWNSCIARPSPLRGVSVPAWREPFLLVVLLQLQPYLILSWPAFSCCIDQGVCLSSSPYLIQKQSLSFTEFMTEAGFFLLNSH